MATVNFYAAARAASGVSVAEIAGEKLGEVVDAATKLFPKLEAILAGCSYLVNGFATQNLDTLIAPQDVIDILPRFAGGAYPPIADIGRVGWIKLGSLIP